MDFLTDLEHLCRRHSPDNPVGMCRKAVDELGAALSREGIEYDVIEGRFVPWRVECGEGSAYHWYIRVPEHESMEFERVILDPTVNQFTEQRYYEDGIEAYVSDEELLDSFVITPSDELYEAYE